MHPALSALLIVCGGCAVAGALGWLAAEIDNRCQDRRLQRDFPHSLPIRHRGAE